MTVYCLLLTTSELVRQATIANCWMHSVEESSVSCNASQAATEYTWTILYLTVAKQDRTSWLSRRVKLSFPFSRCNLLSAEQWWTLLLVVVVVSSSSSSTGSGASDAISPASKLRLTAAFYTVFQYIETIKTFGVTLDNHLTLRQHTHAHTHTRSLSAVIFTSTPGCPDTSNLHLLIL